MVRVPKPEGNYITRSVTPMVDELTTLKKCKDLRDSIGIPIWGEVRWQEILSVPYRSVSKPRKKTATPSKPRNGVALVERRNGFAWVARWCEPFDASTGSEHQVFKESITRGKQVPRRERSAWFSFGGERSRFSTSEEAYAAAVERREIEEARWYCVLDTTVHCGRKANKIPT